MKRLYLFILILLLAASCARTDGSQLGGVGATETALAATIKANVLRPTATFTPIPSPTVTLESVQQRDISPDDFATFIMDVTILDYSPIEAGTTFTKTWRLKNNTPVTWTSGYKVIFESGEQMGAPLSIPIPTTVLPDQFVDITIEFTAPTTPGEYRSNWMLENTRGQKFGVGEKGDSPFYLIIVAYDPATIATSGGVQGGARIIDAAITIDNPNYAGPCPVEITLSGSIATLDEGAVIWSLKFDTATPGFVFEPSGTHSLTFRTNGGTEFWEYPLTINSSVVASAQLSVVGANAALSNKHEFIVTCQ